MFSVLDSSPRPRRRRLNAVASGLLAVSCLVLVTTSADAALSRLGPIDPATNFPSFYTDPSGLSLQPCLDGPPLCVGTEDELLGPAAGAGGEGFYYSAQASVGGFDMAFDLEMAFLDVVTAPIVFQRVQFASRGNLLAPGGTYTILHPYGTSTCTADAFGNVANNACRTDTGGAAPHDFTGALGGPIGPFLTWDTFGDAAGAPPTGHIGDGDSTPHRIEGGPVRNFVQVSGPGISASTDLFNVFGKLAPGPMGSTSQRSIDFGSLAAPASSRITYRSVGTESISVAGVTGSGPFTVTANTCTGVRLTSGAQCDVDVTFTPTPGIVSSGALTIADETGTKVIPLAGKGRLGVASLSTSSVIMAGTRIGKERTDVVTVTNTGDLDLTVAKVGVDGQNPYDFRRGLVRDDCVAGASLAPGAACNVGVIFSPRTRGLRSAVLTVPTSVGTQAVALAGTGVGKDAVAPVLRRHSPAAGATGVKRRANVVVVFSEGVRGVDRRTLRLTVAKSGSVVRAKVTRVSGDVWMLVPRKKLKSDTFYRVRVGGARSGIVDRAGNPLRTASWRFRTR